MQLLLLFACIHLLSATSCAVATTLTCTIHVTVLDTVDLILPHHLVFVEFVLIQVTVTTHVKTFAVT